ncbi:MAG TPA: DUF5329 family protein [Burkholderiaceae bacterium]|nr:DUF5329 family protein [Burkholderiaceae bacterium]HRP27333.1 DUF5329 family protein [Burkholderiaceae bacterium]
MIDRRRLLAASLLAAAGGVRAAPDGIEAARIERLIHFVETRKDMVFVRNGKDHSSGEAALFLRAKYAKMGGHVTTAAQFIDQIASRSSTTGEIYKVRFADGRLVPAGKVLREELARIDRGR